jgi:hypothetical protein
MKKPHKEEENPFGEDDIFNEDLDLASDLEGEDMDSDAIDRSMADDEGFESPDDAPEAELDDDQKASLDAMDPAAVTAYLASKDEEPALEGEEEDMGSEEEDDLFGSDLEA